jgi:predicted small secreted protein
MGDKNIPLFSFDFKEDLHRVLLASVNNFSPINNEWIRTKREKYQKQNKKKLLLLITNKSKRY